MSKLLNCKIDVTKINKSMLFTGAKGTYLDLSIWLNDKPDQYGNDVSIEQRTEKGATKIYLGNGKTYQPKQAAPQLSPAPVSSMTQYPERITAENEQPDDLPW
jgi:hypothetical protein